MLIISQWCYPYFICIPPSIKQFPSVVTVAGICNSVGSGVFLTYHQGAGAAGKYRSMSKFGLLINIGIATNHWPFLLCIKLGHVVHLSSVIRCLAFMGMQYAPGIAGQSVLSSVPSPSQPSSQCTHQPPPPLLYKLTDYTSSPRYKIVMLKPFLAKPVTVL